MQGCWHYLQLVSCYYFQLLRGITTGKSSHAAALEPPQGRLQICLGFGAY